MTNNRQKGKRIEKWFATALRPLFPNVRRNAGIQSQSGGRDLEETGDFAFEIKGGKKYRSKMIRDVLDQAESERGDKPFVVGLIKPERETPYAIVPFNDFIELIRNYQQNRGRL